LFDRITHQGTMLITNSHSLHVDLFIAQHLPGTWAFYQRPD